MNVKEMWLKHKKTVIAAIAGAVLSGLGTYAGVSPADLGCECPKPPAVIGPR